MGRFFMSKYSFSKEEKLAIIKFYQDEPYSLSEVAKIFNVHQETIIDWQNNYRHFGEDGLERLTKQKFYSKELKLAAVQDYLSGDLSLREVTRKYRISSRTVLRNWLKKYTSHSELRDSGKGMSQAMTKGRKTTVEERVEIAKTCVANGKNYQEAAIQYGVSYQQVYQWVRKLELEGEEALEDRRGRTKPAEEHTPEDELRIKIQQVERENERLRAENLFLKKLEEIERRDR